MEHSGRTLVNTKNPEGRGAEDRFYMSHTEIAEVLGVSRQRVAQIEASAIRKIRKALKQPHLPRHERMGKAMPR